MAELNSKARNEFNLSGEMDYEKFKDEFEKLSGICLSLYKEKQMKRRINTLIERKGFDEYRPFFSLIRTDPAELAAFVDYITINVTEFFRTPEHWEYMKNEALSELMRRQEGKLKIWSTACSIGEEPYSLAITLLEMGEDPSQFEILATDIDEKVLQFAKEGQYSAKSLENLPKQIRDRYFIPQGAGFTVTKELRDCVKFRHLDLLTETYPRGCDLIVCRNVLIYFTDEAKQLIYRKFSDSLKTGGYLFTGNTEQIIYYKMYDLKKVKNYLYRK